MKKVALYRHFDAEGRLLYVGISQNPSRRLREHNARAEWSDAVERSEIIWFETRGAAIDAEAAAIAAEKPLHNKPLARGVKKPVGPLGDYLKSNGITQLEFAEALRVSQPTINRWASGKFRPSWFKAAEIERLTGGAVPVSSWAPAA